MSTIIGKNLDKLNKFSKYNQFFLKKHLDLGDI